MIPPAPYDERGRPLRHRVDLPDTSVVCGSETLALSPLAIRSLGLGRWTRKHKERPVANPKSPSEGLGLEGILTHT